MTARLADAMVPHGNATNSILMSSGQIAEVKMIRSDPASAKSFLLQRVQPALTGLIDGSLSTLAPIFAAISAALGARRIDQTIEGRT